jgi:hypothetical protein
MNLSILSDDDKVNLEHQFQYDLAHIQMLDNFFYAIIVFFGIGITFYLSAMSLIKEYPNIAEFIYINAYTSFLISIVILIGWYIYVQKIRFRFEKKYKIENIGYFWDLPSNIKKTLFRIYHNIKNKLVK